MSAPHHAQEPTLKPGDEAILLALARLHYLTAEQVRRLRGWAMLNYTRSTLKRLERAGYIQRFRLRNPLVNGSAPLVATLSTQGWHAVARLGEDIESTRGARRDPGASHLFLPHTLAINDVLIGAMTLPGARLLALSHERELRRRPGRIRVGSRTVTVIPDAWLELGYCGYAYPLALELDRGTEEQRRWRQKVAALCVWATDAYPTLFERQELTVAVVAQPGGKRLAELKRWTEVELSRRGAAERADLFRFTAADPRAPEEFFLDAVWATPFTDELRPLLDGDDVA